MIANLLPRNDKCKVGGRVEVNGVSPDDDKIVWSVRDTVLCCEKFHIVEYMW